MSGLGQASEHLASYDDQFNCRMTGTFNVRLKTDFLATPTIETHNRWYWFAMLSKGNEGRYCWVTRDKGSEQPRRMVELLSKAPLPALFCDGQLTLEVFDRWTFERAREWADGQYWFQSWPWTPTQKADSQFVWDAIEGVTEWTGKRVLDIGGNAGFHSFRAAHAGARCLVVEPSRATCEQGRIIAQNIEQQDVLFAEMDTGGKFDIILYMSVHHQVDIAYTRLPETLIEFGNRAAVVIVELHVDPLDGDKPVRPYYTESEIDGMFTKKLATYQSNVRGRRSVYLL